MTEDKKREIDEVTGVETTGHEWDGLKELNNPAPRWWLWVFYICIIWSVVYFVLFPAWPIPGGATKGMLGYTQNKDLAQSQAEIAAKRKVYLDKFEKASFDDVLKDPTLYAFAQTGGAVLFKENCAACHGAGGAGNRKAYPNLTDDDWLWGGKIEDIYQTIRYGIRSGDDDARVSQMPAFIKDGLLSKEDAYLAVDYVRGLTSDKKPENFAAGEVVFKANCASCHGEDAKGGRDFGAPNLTDAIWLYGSDRDSLRQGVANGRGGIMPMWHTRLSENDMRQLAVYVHQLGGGEKSDVATDTATGGGVETPAVTAPQNEEAVPQAHDGQ